MSRILFLYATNNSGHQKAAEAIKKCLTRTVPDIDISEVDFFTYHYPTVGPFLFKMYVEIMRSIPQTWDYLYDSPGVATATQELRKMFNQLNIPKLHQVLKEFRPQAVVCTQAVPAGFTATEKVRGKISIPLFVAITDFVANPYWPDSQVDCYFVPCPEIKDDLLKRNIPEHRIRVTGIPIDPSYAQRIPKTVIRKKLGLKAGAPTVLVMGGSQGIGLIQEAVKLLAANRSIQIIVAAGNNYGLCRYLRREYANLRNVIVFGYVKNIGRLMDAADLLISKPGGLSSAEAMAKGLPMIILSPLPGQEERNASYLVKNGIAERCENIAQLPRIVEGFLSHPAKLKRFQTQSLSLGRPYASQEIANHLLNCVL